MEQSKMVLLCSAVEGTISCLENTRISHGPDGHQYQAQDPDKLAAEKTDILAASEVTEGEMKWMFLATFVPHKKTPTHLSLCAKVLQWTPRLYKVVGLISGDLHRWAQGQFNSNGLTQVPSRDTELPTHISGDVRKLRNNSKRNTRELL